MLRRSLCLLVLGLGCASPGPPPEVLESEPPPSPKPVVEPVGPGPILLPAGGALVVPPGFTARVEGGVATLLEPDGAAEIWMVEIDKPDLEAAISAAWKTVDPKFAREAENVVEPPAKDGWEALRIESYAADPHGTEAQAIARKHHGRAWVALLRGAPAALDKRAAQIRSFFGSLKVPGLVEIDLTAVAPKPSAASKDELERFIHAAMEAAHAPGLELAIVEGGKVVYANGFGVKEIGKPGKVDKGTLMMIGSVTKSLTTLMMATAVDDKKLDWKAKAKTVVPELAFAGSPLADSLTVEELVCACAGIPRRDVPLILEFEKKQPEDVYKELALMTPSTGLRETFQYQNHMVAAGGYLAARALYPKLPMGVAYDRAMKERVLGPLGMKRSTFDLDQAVKDKNHATPHALGFDLEHHLVSLEHERFATYVRPSGGLWSSVDEMALYLIDELEKGAVGKKRIASAANLTHRWEQQVAISADVYYGLGFTVGKTKGIRMISHGGGTMGFVTFFFFLPEKNVGAVMISNGTGGHHVEQAIKSKLMELWFAIDDQSQAQLDVALAAQKQMVDQLMGKTEAPDVAWIEPYLGEHLSAELGSLKIEKTGDDYWLDAGAYKTRLLRYNRPDGKSVLLFRDPPLLGMELETADDGTMVIDRAQERYVIPASAPAAKKIKAQEED